MEFGNFHEVNLQSPRGRVYHIFLDESEYDEFKIRSLSDEKYLKDLLDHPTSVVVEDAETERTFKEDFALIDISDDEEKLVSKSKDHCATSSSIGMKNVSSLAAAKGRKMSSVGSSIANEKSLVGSSNENTKKGSSVAVASHDIKNPHSISTSSSAIGNVCVGKGATVGVIQNISAADGESGGKKKIKKPKLSTLFQGELLDEAEAYLLNLVLDRPPIYDYKLPLADRLPELVLKLWTEVHEKMTDYIHDVVDENIKIHLDVLKETLITHRTAYMRSKAKPPSGSKGGKEDQIKHKQIMLRYDVVANKRRTTSTTFDDDDYDDGFLSSNPRPPKKEYTPPVKRARVNEEFLSVATKVLENVSSRLENKITDKENTNSTTKCRIFIDSLLSDLEVLDQKHFNSAKMRITQVMYEEMEDQLK